ncbi:MAG: IS1380 family transposase [Planctomycetota bacterium]
MTRQDALKLRRRKRRIRRRLKPRNFKATEKPVFGATNPHYEVSDRIRCVKAGGIGAIHAMAKRIGLVEAIDDVLELLKVHLPYHESDHVLNLAYNVLAGHTRLEDLELLRHDEAYMDMLGTPRIPDPTTAGDFLRRFREHHLVALMEVLNRIRVALWLQQPRDQRQTALIDVDGTVVGTTGEKKEGMSLSYKGIWGYAPLLVSLANFKEPLFLVNRPGNAPSHQDAAVWIDRAIALCQEAFAEVVVRGDSDFSLTKHFDRWDEVARFYFAYDAKPNLVQIADSLPDSAWAPLERRARYEVATQPRAKRGNAKEQVVRQKEYQNLRLVSEDVAEIEYRPSSCRRTYRLVIVRKNLTVERGETWLFDDWRYFFYITNDFSSSAEEVVWQSNDRCDQENLARELGERLLDLARESGVRPSEMAALLTHSRVVQCLGQIGRGLDLCERGLTLARELGAADYEACALKQMGSLQAVLGRADLAEGSLRESLVMFRESGNRLHEAEALLFLGHLAVWSGDEEQARRLYEEALSLQRKVSSSSGVIDSLTVLGQLEARSGRMQKAVEYVDEAIVFAGDLTEPDGILRASVHRAVLPDGDIDAALDTLRQYEERVAFELRMDARFQLWKGTNDPEHLSEAHRLLCIMRDHSPEEYRTSMIENVPLHRDIMQAWGEHGEKAE